MIDGMEGKIKLLLRKIESRQLGFVARNSNRGKLDSIVYLSQGI